MSRNIRKEKSNQGNSFIIVIATLSFLAVLTTALLVAVGVCYRMKAYDINSRDNFYYLEQAMDNLYEGVGSIAMKHLNSAYSDVTDVIVVYDTEKKAYVTMDDEDANQLLSTLFIDKLKNESTIQTSNIVKTLGTFLMPDGTSEADINSRYDAATKTFVADGGITLSAGNTNFTGKDTVVIQNVVLKRKAEYSTVNSYKDDTKTAAPAEYVQSITTDMVITAPKFNLDFSSIDNDDLFDFVMISDMGVEIDGASTKSVINGDMYAANDFYNKDYNYDADTNVTPYEDGDSELDAYNGVTERSMYSGLYVNKAKVSIVADRIIVPGSIAAMNCAQLSVVGSGKEESTGTINTTADSITNHKLAQVWADNIVLGGYAKKTGSTTGKKYKGSNVQLCADAYVSDDLEINATGSKYALDGNYYGYNNATTDKRSYSRAYLAKVLDQSKYSISSKNDVKIVNGNYEYKDGRVVNLPGQSHYNSSSIVVNGQNSELDLSKTDAMYIAGQAYVEMSKDTKAAAYAVRTSGDTDDVDVTELKEGVSVADVEAAEQNPYAFTDKTDDDYSDYHETVEQKDDGTLEYNVEYSDGTDDDNKRIEDYRTGEGLSVKSNQLAYIPPYNVEEDPDTGKAYVSWPKLLKEQDYFKDLFTNLDKIPVVKTVVSNKTYYFYDFTGTDVDMSEYVRHYAELFSVPEGAEEGTRSTGDLADLYDITNWEQFTIGSILINEDEDTNKLYSNSAISVKKDTDSSLRVIADSKKIEPLFKVNSELNLSQTLASSGTDATPLQAATVSTDLQKRYKSLKVLLTDSPTQAAAKNDVNAAVDTAITPINTYFDYTKLTDATAFTGKQRVNNSGVVKNDGAVTGAVQLQSNYLIFESDKDVEVSAPDSSGKVMGVVICKGDVTFDNSVKEFHGLIVAGGKIKVDHSVNFVANREIVKAVLDECENSRESELRNFLALFKHYDKTLDAESTEVVSNMKSVSSVEYEDVLGFSNWQKNVN